MTRGQAPGDKTGLFFASCWDFVVSKTRDSQLKSHILCAMRLCAMRLFSYQLPPWGSPLAPSQLPAGP
jgi:hypothetical protein